MNQADKLNEKNSIILPNLKFYSLCVLPDGRLAASSEDKNIKIYDIKNNNTLDIELTGHNDEVFYVTLLPDGKLISSSRDNTVKIWTINNKSFECVATLSEHKYYVLKAIPISKDRICSCSADKTIKIWDSKNYNLLKTIEGHGGWIRSIIQLKNKDIILSGSCDDHTFRFWDTNTYECKNILDYKGICFWQNSLCEVGGGKVMIGGTTKIIVISTESFQIIATISTPFQENVPESFGEVSSLLYLGDNTGICGDSNGGLYRINLCEYNLKLLKEKGHNKDVISIVKLGEKEVVTSSIDGAIKFWTC